MFREMVAGFEEERAASEARVQDLGRLLHQAVADIQGLQVRGARGTIFPHACAELRRFFLAAQARNADLNRQLIEAAAWEPPAY